MSTNRESDRFIVRMPDGMRDRIKAEAEKAGRSMNAEIVAALELWLGLPSPSQSRRQDLLKARDYTLAELSAMREQMDRLHRRLADLDSEIARLDDPTPSPDDD